MELIKTLTWRYAVKKFKQEKVPNEKIDQIVEAISLSASSTGLQPYRIFSISNEEIRKELGKESFNTQIVEASHLLAFAAFDTVTRKRIEDLIRLMAEQRGIPETDLADYKNVLESYLLARTDQENFIWSAKQAYIALGTALIAASNLKVDASPMEGFDSEKLDKLLNLKAKRTKKCSAIRAGIS